MRLSTLYKETLHGGDLYAYGQSPFLFWCNRFAPVSEKDAESDYDKLLKKRGIQFEESTVREQYPGIKQIKVWTTEGILKELKAGPTVLWNMPIFNIKENLSGVTDLIVRVDTHKSKFGNFHYIVKELKNAKHLRKQKYILQTAYYNYILGELQGYTPKYFYVVGREGEEKFEYSKYEDLLVDSLADIKHILKGKKVAAVYKAGPPWDNYSKKKAIREKSLTLISGLGSSAQENLLKAGYHDITDLHKASVEDLCEVNRLGEATAKKLKLRAQSLIEKKMIIGKLPDWSENSDKLEIYYDMEATQPDEELGIQDQIIYLHGMIVKNKFIDFTADSLADEGKAFKEFLKYFKDKKDFVIYHYHIFERTQFKKLCEKYGCPQKLKDKILDSMVDISKPFLSAQIVLPIYGNGLKDIAPYLGFNWSQGDVNAKETMAMYLEYAETGNKSIYKKILKYNEDDVRATKVIVDWVKGLKAD